jgi:hypothetical protein
VTQIRSTLLSASLQGIRSMGWEERYLAALPPALHSEMSTLTAGFWVPISLGLAHYGACDAMGLTAAEMNTIGEEVSLRTQKTFVGTLGRAVTEAGFTPWHLLGHTHRIWGRMVDGADTRVTRLGPKEAVVTLVSCPLVELLYFRVGLTAYYRALARLFCRVAYTREAPEGRKNEAFAFRISWV